MDVVLLHDARDLPFDLYLALTGAGHRVASHGTALPAASVFLDAIKWAPQAFVLDFRGASGAAREALAWLAAAPRWAGTPVVLAFARAEERPGLASIAPGARFAASPDEVVAALAPQAGSAGGGGAGPHPF